MNELVRYHLNRAAEATEDRRLKGFLKRMLNGEPLFVIDFERSWLNQVVGLPEKSDFIFIDRDLKDFEILKNQLKDIGVSEKSIEEWEEQDYPKRLYNLLIDDRLNTLAKGQPVEKENEKKKKKKTFYAGIMIPARDYKMIQRAVKKGVRPADPDIIGRVYQHVEEDVRITAKLCLNEDGSYHILWGAYRGLSQGFVHATSMYSVLIRMKNGSIVVKAQFEIDPTYE
jgi:hypothetical protein